MREKQPIDELFKRTLFDAEVSPPTAVRDALGHKLGWVDAVRNTPGSLPLLMLIIGLAGAGGALWSWNSDQKIGDDQNVQIQVLAPNHAEVVSNEQETIVSKNALPLITAQISTNLSDRTTNASGIGSHQDDHGSASGTNTRRSNATPKMAAVSAHTTDGAVRNAGRELLGSGELVMSNDQMVASHKGSVSVEQPSEEPRAHTSAQKERPEPPTTVRLDPSEITSAPQITEEGLREPQALDEQRWVPETGQSAWGNLGLMATYLEPMAVQSMSDLSPGKPTTRPTPLMYVLPKGTWWIGAFVGMGTVNGHWKGDQVGDLDHAEHWKSTFQGGLLLGRVWRSGWSVSAGVGASRVRSKFQFDENGPASNFSELDTTWATGIFAGTSVYTWNIDTLQVQVPGRSVSREARNNYTAVQVPITLGWHGELRRLRYGAFAGVMAWIPAERKGLTLQRDNTDGPSSTIPLQDNKVQDRFGIQLHGSAGLSMGYALTEHFDAYVEPMVTSPIFGSGKGDMPWLTRPTLQLRFQYEL